jgi:hypothetical protein
VLDIDVQSYFDSIDWELLLKVVRPAVHALVRDRDPALGEQILAVAKAEREPEIEPDRLMYDLSLEPISGVADFPHTLGYSALRTSNKLPPA